MIVGLRSLISSLLLLSQAAYLINTAQLASATPVKTGAADSAKTIAAKTATAKADSPANQAVQEGERLSKLYKYDEAEKQFNEALKTNPRDVAALLGLGKLYRHKGKATLSFNAIKLAISLAPTNALCYVESAKLLHTLHRYPRAIKACQRAIELAPNNAEAYFYLGWCQDLMDQEIEATNNLRKAVQLNPKNHGAWTVLAFTLWQRDRHSEAVKCMQTAISLAPKNSQYQSELADIFVDEHKLTEAAAVYSAMKKNFPKSAEGYLGLSDIAALQSKTKLRGELIEQAIKVKSTSPKAWLCLAQFHLEQRKFDEAIRCSRIALGFKPTSALSNKALAICLIQADRPKEAEEYLQKSIVNAKTHQEKQASQELLVHLHFLNNKNDRAMELAREMYTLAPKDYWSISAMAWALMCFKRYDEGFALLEKGKKLFPNDTGFDMDLLGGLVSAERYAQAKALGKKLLLKRPNEPYIWLCLMTVATKTHNKKDAEEAMKHTQGLKMSSYEAMEMGFAGIEIGADAASQASLKQAIEDNPTSVDLIMNTRDPKAEKKMPSKPAAKK
ncbi:hypothetical protein BH11CYA1_BH11CYA1_28200 [soil metagenome]